MCSPNKWENNDAVIIIIIALLYHKIDNGISMGNSTCNTISGTLMQVAQTEQWHYGTKQYLIKILAH